MSNSHNNLRKACPCCGETTKKLPTRIVKCDAVTPTEGYE